ncbi:Centrosome-associated zinc finger protein [Pseudolycoriella hygida]|uniref:Centrosome-associated zinc finger protein n=1 Tax=Pseudolycoriella hygida TaxID=35572 RepID=A0A9Q0MMF6_9DIPT|nr:Centrosome-associated zinc finger protein [Pseudolycoriella hygida]
MVEVKSVKVDNWGVFFLQKLQNFFNKTDYCDLTLQFNDNSQLKVHRLVLSACTDFFNLLEQQCQVLEDILIMPPDLQADVVVPIVNFMYTGTLEFEVAMYSRLLKTARDMKMTVLLKLLEAHRRTIEPKPRPILLNKSASPRAMTYSRSNAPTESAVQPPTRTYTPRKVVPITKNVKTERTEFKVAVRPAAIPAFIRKTLPEPVQLVTMYASNTSAASKKGPSRFDCSDEITMPEQFESSFDNISYESIPLQTAIKEEKEVDINEPSTSSSFEQLRRGYTGPVKRPASGLSYSSPPEKKPNIQDVKEYTEAHRQRKQIVAEEFDEEAEYVDDNFESPSSVKTEPEIDDKHTKIIHDVLKKYPHLVKNKQNIKLKITKSPVQTTTVKQAPAQPIASVATTKPTVTPPANAAPTKRIDSKRMHALIALGAENMEGPWLCLRCGVDGRPISIPSYKGFRRHLIATHKEKIDPRICEHCGFKVNKRPDMHYHCLIKHNIVPPHNVVFPKCDECPYIAPDVAALLKHRETHHKTKNLHHCIYCNKTFSNEILLYNHIRSNHKERACEDGVLDFDEDEEMLEASSYVPNNEDTPSGSNKIKILSNIELPVHTISTVATQDINLEPSSEAEALSNVATGIATSLGVLDNSDELHFINTDVNATEQHAKNESSDNVTVTQFITEDGSLSTLQLTSSEKADLVRQMENQEGVVMILNDNFDHGQELIVNNSEQQGIVVVYSQPEDGQKQGTASQGSGDGCREGNGSSIDDDFKMDIESGDDGPEKKDSKDKENSEAEMEQSADHSSLDSTFEHSLNEEYYEEKTDDDDKEEVVNAAPAVDKEADKKKDIGDKKLVQKLLSEVKDDWSDGEDELEVPKVEKKEIERKEKPSVKKDAPQKATKVSAKVEKTYKYAGKKASDMAAKTSLAGEQKSTRATRNKAEITKQVAKSVAKDKLPSKGHVEEGTVEAKDEDGNVADNTVESTDKKEVKNDVKELLSADWGDDDHDDDDY